MRVVLQVFAHICFIGFLAFVALLTAAHMQTYADSIVFTNNTTAMRAATSISKSHSAAIETVSAEYITRIVDQKNNQNEVLATNTASSTVIDAGAPLSLPTPVTTPASPAPQQNSVASTPYILNEDANGQLASLGYSLASLQAQGITVIGHSGSVPRRCATGTSGGLYAQGMALRASVRYTPCPDGGSPLYVAY